MQGDTDANQSEAQLRGRETGRGVYTCTGLRMVPAVLVVYTWGGDLSLCTANGGPWSR